MAEQNDDDAKLWEEVGREFDYEAKLNLDADVDGDASALKYEKLSQLVQNEIISPDLLPSQLFDHLKVKVDQVKSDLFDCEADDEDEKNPLERTILEMDAKRWEYELVLLNRTRIQKIAKYASYFLKHRTGEMSIVERDFAEEYSKLRQDYMQAACLSHLPLQSRDLEEQRMGGSIDLLQDLYAQPDFSKHVVFRALKDLGSEVFPGSEDKIVLEDTTWTCPYEDIKRFVDEGDVLLM